jgi:maltose O-acetyltransferase
MIEQGRGVPTNRSFAGLIFGLKLDLGSAIVNLFTNTIAGSTFVPRAVRFVLYRLLGLDVSTPDIAAGQRIHNRNVSFGRQSVVNRACFFEGRGRISIGAFCMIGPEVAFVTSTHRGDGQGGIVRRTTCGDVAIHDHVWVGARCIMLAGATVGDGCIIVAGSVVTGTCEPGFIYAGIPARKVGRVAALPTD